MKKMLVTSILLSSVLLVACNDDDEKTKNETPQEEIKKETTTTDVKTKEKVEVQDDTTSDEKNNDNTDEKGVVNNKEEQKVVLTKMDFLEEVQKIHKELNELPEKEDADKGVTNAMKSYYGVSYERFDELLTKVMDQLKTTLPNEQYTELEQSVTVWKAERATNAEVASQPYEAGSFAHVAFYISLYDDTLFKVEELIHKHVE